MDKTYKVTDKKGILVAGERIPEGEKLTGLQITAAQVRAFLRFNQIEEAKAPAKKQDKAPAKK